MGKTTTTTSRYQNLSHNLSLNEKNRRNRDFRDDRDSTRLKLTSASRPNIFKSKCAMDAREFIKVKVQEIKDNNQRILIDVQQDIRNRNKNETTAKFLDTISDTEDFYNKSNRDRLAKEPKITITGLGNVRLQGDSLKIVKESSSSLWPSAAANSREKALHRTVSNRDNTYAAANKRKEQHDEIIEIDKRASVTNNPNKAKFQNIRIKIDNDKMASSDTESMDYQEPQIASSYVTQLKSAIQQAQPVVQTPINYGSVSTSSHSGIDLHSNNGFKLIVSNLHPKVTEDDVLELFSDIGPIKRARFLEKGIAEVVYVKLEDAKQAIAKYHHNELDGRPMIIELNPPPADSNQNRQQASHHHISSTIRIPDEPVFNSSKSDLSQSILFKHHSSSSSNVQFKHSSSPLTNFQVKPRSPVQSSSQQHRGTTSSSKNAIRETTLSDKFKNLTNEKFVLPDSLSHSSKKIPGARVDKVDAELISQILFNKKPLGPSNPVTFTVKI